MKGLVFKEFLEMVDDVFGEEITEKIIEKSNLKSGGAYTSVGTYDHSEILDLVTHLAEETSSSVDNLVKTFGKHLVGVFQSGHKDFFDHPDVFSFLKSVHGIIHVEVKKLYPDAELPEFLCEEPQENVLIMKYSSKRPFADLAEGLISGVVDVFDEDVKIESIDLPGEENTARKFILTKAI